MGQEAKGTSDEVPTVPWRLHFGVNTGGRGKKTKQTVKVPIRKGPGCCLCFTRATLGFLWLRVQAARGGKGPPRPGSLPPLHRHGEDGREGGPRPSRRSVHSFCSTDTDSTPAPRAHPAEDRACPHAVSLLVQGTVHGGRGLFVARAVLTTERAGTRTDCKCPRDVAGQGSPSGDGTSALRPEDVNLEERRTFWQRLSQCLHSRAASHQLDSN